MPRNKKEPKALKKHKEQCLDGEHVPRESLFKVHCSICRSEFDFVEYMAESIKNAMEQETKSEMNYGYAQCLADICEEVIEVSGKYYGDSCRRRIAKVLDYRQLIRKHIQNGETKQQSLPINERSVDEDGHADSK